MAADERPFRTEPKIMRITKERRRRLRRTRLLGHLYLRAMHNGRWYALADEVARALRERPDDVRAAAASLALEAWVRYDEGRGTIDLRRSGAEAYERLAAGTSTDRERTLLDPLPQM